MLERLPQFVEPLHLAEVKGLLKGHVALADMRRLAPSLCNPEDQADVDLEFGKDAQRVPYMRGRIDARVTVVCQRCLQPLTLPLHTEPRLALVTTPEAAETLPPHYEPLLVSAQPMRLADLVEDELLLALPIVPKHADEQCHAGVGRAAARDAAPEKPFAALARLKRKR
ncbi:MAG: YceD family protein [Pseudomonadota bacterium]